MDTLGKKAVTHVENHVNREKNFVILKRKLKELNGVKEDNESAKSKQLMDPRKKLKKSAEIWFQNVERITVETNDLENEITRSNVLSSIGGKVLERIQEVEDLLQKGQNFDSLVIDDPQRIGQVLSTTTLFGEVPKKLMKEIWEYLMDDKFPKIGVCGMGGVGKTTIMKLIHNKLIEETEKFNKVVKEKEKFNKVVKETEKFNKVVWVTVSKEINITKLQNDIQRETGASDLLKDDDDQTVRAGKLLEVLSNLSGKYVLILDDLWANLSLEEVGIPEPSNGSKLVITTRLLNVCHYLNCREVKIPSLPPSDAWELFLEKVGHDISNDRDLEPIVEEVAKECDGLPLAIVTIASSMRRERDIPIWRDALRKLQEHGTEEKIFQQLRFSYDRLEDETLKLCFLCCALYPEDFEIGREELINLWIAEGYVEEMSSLQAEIDKGHAILNKLKNSSLIEDGSSFYHRNSVKLHDIVRDMALRITRPQFLVRAGMNLMKLPDLKEWKEGLEKALLMKNRALLPYLKEWKEGTEKVSLMRNWGLKIPSKMPPPNCPVLTTLLLADCDITSIPDRFFEQMPGLKILDLSDTLIESLPNSIPHLESLTTLLLRGCGYLKEIPSLSKLQALKKLDLFDTGLEELPYGIDELVNLRYLNLSDVPLSKIDLGILANLTSLLHLEMIPSYDCEEEMKIEFGGMAGIELLLQLQCLVMAFKELDEFNSYMQALEDTGEGKGPPRFKIIVSPDIEECDEEVEEEKLILIRNTVICTENIKLPSNVESLKFWDVINRGEDEVFLSNLITCCGNNSFSSLKEISIDGLKGIRKLFSLDWILDNLQNLEHLAVRNDYDDYCYYDDDDGLELNEIIGLESKMDLEVESAKYCTLPRLKTLVLQDLPELKSICSEKVVIVCDSIERIEIMSCPKLKKIPLISSLRDDDDEIIGLESKMDLEVKSVKYCTLPRLKVLELWDLPKLKSICSEKVSTVTLPQPNKLELSMACNSIERIEIFGCPKLKKIPLIFPLGDNGLPSPPPSLKEILASPEDWWGTVEWYQPEVKSMVEHLVKHSKW